MKKIFVFLILYMAILMGASAQTANTYFQYPTVPENITSLSGRCNYMVMNFWERCDFKSAFSSLARLEKAFADFVSFMPYASADTAYMSIDKLLEKVKKSPAQTLAICTMAKANLYADTAYIVSEDLYLPFAKAVVENKKISAADRAPFERDYKIVANTRIGQRMPDITFYMPEGGESRLSANIAPMVILFLTGPDCSDCSLYRVRLSADYALTSMIKEGRLKIINLYVGPEDAGWTETVASAPEGWIIGRCPEIAEYFDIKSFPYIAYLNRKMEILGKNFTVDDIIDSFRRHVLSH